MTNFEKWKETLTIKEAAHMLDKTMSCDCRDCPISPKGTFRPCDRKVKKIKDEDFCNTVLEKWFKQEAE